MRNKEILKQSAELDETTVKYLSQLTEGTKILQFENLDERNSFQKYVEEGFVEKDYRSYTLTEKGSELLECHAVYNSDTRKYEQLLKEGNENTITIKYKIHEEKENVIKDEYVVFDVNPQDNIPVVQVDEDVYANLIHRERGQHWKQYLGEDGRQLIRQKKLTKFYVEDINTKRRYLYIMP